MGQGHAGGAGVTMAVTRSHTTGVAGVEMWPLAFTTFTTHVVGVSGDASPLDPPLSHSDLESPHQLSGLRRAPDPDRLRFNSID